MTEKPLKILSIDDDEFIRIFLKDIFWMHGGNQHDLTVFPNIKKARQFMTDPKNKPDLIFLDLRLPEEDGGPVGVENSFKFLKDIKTSPETKDVKVIIFSSFGDKEIQDKAVKLGACKFLIKGESLPSEILRIVKELTEETVKQKPKIFT